MLVRDFGGVMLEIGRVSQVERVKTDKVRLEVKQQKS